jgi:hypothetical protein
MKQAGERQAEAGLRGLAGDERVALGDEGEAQRGVDLPDPVGARVCHVPEARLARLDGVGRRAGMAQDGAIASAGVTARRNWLPGW